MKVKASIAFVLIGAAGAFTGGGETRADVVSSAYLNDQTFVYEIAHMPDLDQRRKSAPGLVGLPGDGGMYCVPTGTVNMMAYIANHGFSFVSPGSGSWQSQSRYNDAGNALSVMGMLMGTTASGGTGGGGWLNGTTAWLNPGLFNVNAYYANGFYSPTIVNMTQTALQDNLVAFAYGRYEFLGDLAAYAPQVGDRKGGHVVTLSKSVRGGNNLIIGVRDPADDPDQNMNPNYLFDQSNFGNRVFNSAKQVTALSLNPVWVRQMTALNYPVPAGTDRISLIDGYVSIGLKYGITFVDTGVQLKIKLLKPSYFLGTVGDPVKAYELASETGIADLVLHPDNAGVVFARNGGAVGDPSKIQLLNTITGEVQDLVTVGDPTGLVFGEKRELYVLSPEKLLCLNLDAADAKDQVMASVVPPVPCKAMTFDDNRDEVILVSNDGRTLFTYRAGLPLIQPSSTVELPLNLQLAGALSVAINPIDGKTWLAGDKSSKLHGFLVNNEGQMITESIELPNGQIPTSLEFDDAGHLFVTSNGLAIEFKRSELSGQWMIVEQPYFGDFEMGKKLRISRSRSNFDPAAHTGPGFVNIDPDELTDEPVVLDCDGDFDGNRVVDVDDLLALINTWGPCEVCLTDLTDDRKIDVDDLLGVINNWGECP